MLPAFLGLALTALALTGAGPATHPETRLVAGWGAYCLLMTAWATTTQASLIIPTLTFTLVALAHAARTSATAQEKAFCVFFSKKTALPCLRMAALTLPLWPVILAARPSQVDTWLNLLPNLAYLTDHASLPADGGPPSHSFLPAAPYNTQFAGYAISLVAGHLVANALSLFNVLLICAAALHLARACACAPGNADPSGPPPWWACALGLLLAAPLNPGFTPRVFLASYGEAPIAVTLLFAASLGADLFAAARAGQAFSHGTPRQTLAALALVLCALVEIKQSALGLVLPFSLTLLCLGLAAPGIARRSWLAAIAAATAPALLLYAAYRLYVLHHFAVGELKMLPYAEWHLNLLPQILAGIAVAIFEKATYFLALLAMLAAALIEARRRPWQRAAILLALGTGLVAGFNAFLLFTYVAHFPANWATHAHSYFRYLSQISLVAVLALATCLQPACAAWLASRTPPTRRRAAAAAIAVTCLLPIAGLRLLRFDLDAPQPFLWDIARRAEPLLQATGRLALVMPGDTDDAVGSLLRGVLLFTGPRRQLDFRTELAATPASLQDARAAGYITALVTCAPAGLAGLPPGTAGLLAFSDGAWRVRAAWPIPPALARTRFSAMLPRRALCEKQAVLF